MKKSVCAIDEFTPVAPVLVCVKGERKKPEEETEEETKEETKVYKIIIDLNVRGFCTD